ncbi:MAG: hypothetical protein QOC96_3725 [Acidobacteriota bacterium]|jgi:hypothetical protein|nr:hypothetical protein [Acidobacteriota bacterium]
MTKEQNLKHVFEVAGRESYLWLSTANHLKRGANLILVELNKSLAVYPYGRASYEELTLCLPYMLLSGYALENLIKGILIGRNPSIIDNGSFNRDMIKGAKDGHISLEMIEQILIDLSKDEKYLIRRLREFVRWESRYPIPNKSIEMEPPEFRTTDPVMINQIFDRLSSILESENASR